MHDPVDKSLIGSLQVASWWDYGYQTTAMANRTVIVDNNTWNNTHIATVRSNVACIGYGYADACASCWEWMAACLDATVTNVLALRLGYQLPHRRNRLIAIRAAAPAAAGCSCAALLHSFSVLHLLSAMLLKA
jgi:hypothetical protein